ncbi:MAG TPA: hypothetical protein VFL66_07380 [Gaiellaceae bacterium]|nr:hypothetical protein [Gaiellaceae bacterium]
MSIPPLDPLVVDEIRSLARLELSYAETWRRLRVRLEQRALRCPSYDAVRVRVIEERRIRARPIESTAPVRANLWAGRIYPK